ncbi:MAG: dipeptide epimerase [Desulfobacterium sp.]|nr:dipeptide epimerase [Desulfobacterium sp.]
MKITAVRWWEESLPLTRPYTIAYQTISAVKNHFVTIETQDGAMGIGVGSPAEEVTGESETACGQALESALEPLLMGKDIRHLNAILRALDRAIPKAPGARAAIDIALHDLAAKHLGLPLVELLGRCHTTLPTSITLGIRTIEETLEEAREYRARGFNYLKVKIGKSIDEDVERLIRLREEVGPHVKIRVDANLGYTFNDLVAFLIKARDVDLELIEQPLKVHDLDEMPALSYRTRNLMAADESLVSVTDALALAGPDRPFGIYNIKLMKCGGIAPAMKIAEIARLAAIDLMWGCMDESIVGISAALHAALASPATRYLDLDGSLDLSRDLVQGGFVLENGMLRVTDTPGLGVQLI